MDYGGGAELWKYQWDFIHDPEGGWYLWEDFDEGAWVVENGLDAIVRNIKSIRCAMDFGQQKVNLYFGRYEYILSIQALAGKLQILTDPGLHKEKIRFFISADKQLFNANYIETLFNTENIVFDEQNRRVQIKGNDFDWFISGHNVSSQNREPIFNFIKSLFTLPMQSIASNVADNLTIEQLHFEPYCSFYNLSAERRKELLRTLSNTNSIKESRQKIIINILKTIPKEQLTEMMTWFENNNLLPVYSGVSSYRSEFLAVFMNLYIQVYGDELAYATSNWQEYTHEIFKNQNKSVYFAWRKAFNADPSSPKANIWYNSNYENNQIIFRHGIGYRADVLSNRPTVRAPINPMDIVVVYFETAPRFLSHYYPSNIRVAMPAVMFDWICKHYNDREVAKFVDVNVSFISFISGLGPLTSAAKAVIWVRAIANLVDVTLNFGFEEFLIDNYVNGEEIVYAWKLLSNSMTLASPIDQLLTLNYISKREILFAAWSQFKLTTEYDSFSLGNPGQAQTIDEIMTLLKDLN